MRPEQTITITLIEMLQTLRGDLTHLLLACSTVAVSRELEHRLECVAQWLDAIESEIYIATDIDCDIVDEWYEDAARITKGMRT
jgi:hypothetical protein